MKSLITFDIQLKIRLLSHLTWVSSSVHSRVRVGIISNQEGDCHFPDSFIGFGGGGSGFKNACGNGASYSPDNGDKNIKAFGYIFVQ